MKKVLAFLLILSSFTACKKDPDVNPQTDTETPAKGAAAAVAGTYKLGSFYLSVDDEELELPQLPLVENGKTVASGTAVLKSSGTDKTDMTFVLKTTEFDDLEFELEDLEVRKVGKVYGLFADGERIGDADGSNIIFNMSYVDPDTKENLTLKFTAKK